MTTETRTEQEIDSDKIIHVRKGTLEHMIGMVHRIRHANSISGGDCESNIESEAVCLTNQLTMQLNGTCSHYDIPSIDELNEKADKGEL